MRIAMLCPDMGRTHSWHDETTPRMVSLLKEGLVRKGIELALFSALDSATDSCPVPHDTTIDVSDALQTGSKDCLPLAELFDRPDDFDLIHNHAGCGPLKFSRLIQRPFLTTLYEDVSDFTLPVYKKYNGQAFYVSLSNAGRSQDLTYEATVPCGIDVESFGFTEAADPYLLYLGPIHPDRGLRDAVEIARLSGRELRFSGPVKDRDRFAEEIAPWIGKDSVNYVEPVGSRRQEGLLERASALLHPVRSESPFDLTILEANACGTPVVAFDRGFLHEVISHGSNGFLVKNVHDAVAAVNGIHKLSRIRCRNIAQERFAHHIMIEQYVKVYERIIERTKTEDRRPWGYYVVLSDLFDHKVKRIVVWPGKRLSLQRHRFRSEHWIIIAGNPIVTLDSEEIPLSPRETVDIPVGTKHRIYNPGQTPAVFIEVQTGDYFGEDDIERFEDDFGRV